MAKYDQAYIEVTTRFFIPLKNLSTIDLSAFIKQWQACSDSPEGEGKHEAQ
jgi:hypothetical protein